MGNNKMQRLIHLYAKECAVYSISDYSARLLKKKKKVKSSRKSKECNINLINITFSFVFVICKLNTASAF